MSQIIAGVMGPGQAATATDLATAYELGQRIAQQGWVLLTGGRNAGVMDAASRGAKQAGGLTVGILPGAEAQHLSPSVDIPILTGMGSARNNINVLSSHIIFACGMGSGTASEVALAIKAGKSVVLLHASLNSQAFFWELAPEQVLIANSPDDAIELAQRIIATR